MRMTVANSKKDFFKDNPSYSKHKDSYIEVCKTFKELFYQEIFKGKEIETPIGNFCIIKFKPKKEFKKKPVDFKTSKEEGFIVRFLNEHSNGYACKISLKSKGTLKKYKFKCVRAFGRRLAKHIFTNPEAYKQYNEFSKH